MEHFLLKAATTAADQGTFEAVISTATIDREKDIVEPQAMVDALEKWAHLGKKMPLAWQHSDAPEDQIGYIDPATARVVNNEVVVKGWIDQATEVGQHAWRMVKMGTLGFSFGYLIPDGGATKRAGGGLHIKEVDLFEVTATPSPMNGDTRVLGWKSADPPPRSAEELRKAADRKERELVEAMLPEEKAVDPVIRILTSMVGQAQEFINTEPDPDDAAAMADVLSVLEGLLADEQDEPADESKSVRLYVRKVTPDELEGVKSGDLKAVWSAAYVNALPDSAFLYVEDGGKKDEEGKTTPRSLRHFPVKDADGNIDLPHLRNALARIPQSSLPQSVKDRLTAEAQRMLDSNTKAVKDVPDKGRGTGESQTPDLQRRRADELALKHLSGGVVPHKSPEKVEPPKPELLPLAALKRQMHDQTLRHLTGVEEL